MRITVAICTHNRATLLARTLKSLSELDVPAEVEWRVLVVRNACSDRTPEVLDAFEDRLPLSHVGEARRGHSHARNRAVAETTGDYLVWTDDDVRVDHGWLQAYATAFRRWPEAAFFGGPIRSDFEGSAPEWLIESFEASKAVRAAYAERDLGPETFAIRSRDDLPYGANMALPVAMQRRHSYDPRLGRSGNDLIGGDELQVLGALLDEGHVGRWVPEASVDHFIPESRQSLDYLRRYFRDQGRIAKPLPEDIPVPRLFGKPRWALRTRVEEELKYRLRRLVSSPTDWMPHLIEASLARGTLMGPPGEYDRRE